MGLRLADENSGIRSSRSPHRRRNACNSCRRCSARLSYSCRGTKSRTDHGVSDAIYLDDPDGNGVELYWDRPKEMWPQNEDGALEMYTKHLDLDNLLNERNH